MGSVDVEEVAAESQRPVDEDTMMLDELFESDGEASQQQQQAPAPSEWREVDEAPAPAASTARSAPKVVISESKQAALKRVMVRVCKICGESSNKVEWFEVCVLWQDRDTGDAITTPIGWVCRVCGEVSEAFICRGNQDKIIELYHSDETFKSQFQGGRSVLKKLKQPNWCPQRVVLRHTRDFSMHQDIAFIKDATFCAHFKAPLECPQVQPHVQELYDWEGVKLSGILMTLDAARDHKLPHTIVSCRSTTSCILDTRVLKEEDTLHDDHARQIWCFHDQTQRDNRPKPLMAKNMSKIEGYDHFVALASDYKAMVQAGQETQLNTGAGNNSNEGGGIVSRSRLSVASAAAAAPPPSAKPAQSARGPKAAPGPKAQGLARASATKPPAVPKAPRRPAAAAADGAPPARRQRLGKFEGEEDALDSLSMASGGAASAAPSCAITLAGKSTFSTPSKIGHGSQHRQSPPTKALDEGVGVSIDQILKENINPGRQIAAVICRSKFVAARSATAGK
eukprot:9471567-Pyramimonas_sp.AAC.1